MLERETRKRGGESAISPPASVSVVQDRWSRAEKGTPAAREQAATEIEADLAEARKRLSEVRLEIERTRGLIDSQAKQVAGIEQRLQGGETEIGQLTTRLQTLEQERGNFSTSCTEMQAGAEIARQRLQAKTAERDACRASFARA